MEFKQLLKLDNGQSIIFSIEEINKLYNFESLMRLFETEYTKHDVLDFIIENLIIEYIDTINLSKIDNKLKIKDILNDITKASYRDIELIISNVITYYTDYMEGKDKKKEC